MIIEVYLITSFVNEFYHIGKERLKNTLPPIHEKKLI